MTSVSNEPPISFDRKFGLLLEHARTHGIPSSYQVVAEATRLDPVELARLHRGLIPNPEYPLLHSLAVYFGVGLDYFDCSTVRQCRNYLRGVRDADRLSKARFHQQGISARSLALLRDVLEYVIWSERLEDSPKVMARALRLVSRGCDRILEQVSGSMPYKTAHSPGTPSPGPWRGVELRSPEVPWSAEQIQLIGDWLIRFLRFGDLSAVERALVGEELDHLGDLRFREDAWHLPDDPLLGFIAIPAGEFLMGSDPSADPDSYSNEWPHHRLDLQHYYISRYPVTVAQFRSFVQATGYRPDDPHSLVGGSNHPVTCVNWHEALAYCDWLTEKLRGWEGLPMPLADHLRGEGWRVTLPSEAEWEKAARGLDERIYPWGGEFDSNLANVRETHVGSTMAVGCLPQGVSPYQVHDMSGNVWEWTRSAEGAYPYEAKDGREDLIRSDAVARVLRGGSFYSRSRNARCASRHAFSPHGQYRNYGFRVAITPTPVGIEA